MKRLLILSFSISSVFSTVAQSPGNGPQKKFGFKAGINYSLMNFNMGVPRPATTVANIWKPGFDIRLLLNLKLSHLVAIQPEYAVALMNGEDPRSKTTYHLNYLSLPLLLRVVVTEKIALLAGPQFDLLIHANKKANGIKTNITHDTEERNISVLAGVELSLPAGFYLDARYVNGFNHVGLGQRSVASEFKWQSFSAGVGLRF
ncbi:MAG: outer membrane beta-barrel protein [Chitinophagaceae bacterium]